VTLEVINPELRKVLGVKDGDRILKVFNKKGDLVYQRAIEPIKQEHLKFAENSKYEGLKAINSKSKVVLSSQEEERYRYPLIALFQNTLIVDPREEVATGLESESAQSVLNLVRLDHFNGTKILKLRFQNISSQRSLDMFAHVAYLDKHLLFLTENYDSGRYTGQSIKMVKLDIDLIFMAD